MSPNSSQPVDRARSYFMGVIDNMITGGRFLAYPADAESLMYERRSILESLEPISAEQVERFRRAALLLAGQVVLFFGPELLYPIARHLRSVEWVILTDSAGVGENQFRGFFKRWLPEFYFMALALTIDDREITRYELASTLFHELVHVADFDLVKIDVSDYKAEFAYLADRGEIDPFLEYAVRSEKEMVARSFQGSLFGEQGPLSNDRQLRLRVSRWRTDNAILVKWVKRDYERLFSDVSLELEGSLVMTLDQTTFRPVRRRDYGIVICIEVPEEPIVYDPVFRGTLLWLREQARLAELDPEREWDGFQAEWDMLMAGTHPDPHPELIIMGREMDDFDPTQLREPKTEMLDSDSSAYSGLGGGDIHFEYPPWSQQLFAARCGFSMDLHLKYSTASTSEAA